MMKNMDPDFGSDLDSLLIQRRLVAEENHIHTVGTKYVTCRLYRVLRTVHIFLFVLG